MDKCHLKVYLTPYNIHSGSYDLKMLEAAGKKKKPKQPGTNFKPYSLSLNKDSQIKRTRFSTTSQLKNAVIVSITDQIM